MGGGLLLCSVVIRTNGVEIKKTVQEMACRMG